MRIVLRMLRVVLSVVLRLFEGCLRLFRVLSLRGVVLKDCLKVVLRLLL